MLFELKWTPSEIRQATRFDLELAINYFNNLHGNTMDNETVERLKGLKYDKS